MSIVDVVLIIIIMGFGLAGLWFGLVRTVISLLGSVLGIYLGARYYAPVADWLIATTGWNPNISRVVIFVISFILINRAVALAFWLLNKVITIITHLPIIRGVDRLLGLAFGLLEGSLVLSVFFYFIARYPLGQNFMNAVGESQVVAFLNKISAVVVPLLPDALKMMQSTIKGLF